MKTVRRARSKEHRELNRIIGSNVRIQRIRKFKSLRELSRSIKIDPSALTRLELGERSASAVEIFLISLTLDVRLQVFFEGLESALVRSAAKK